MRRKLYKFLQDNRVLIQGKFPPFKYRVNGYYKRIWCNFPTFCSDYLDFSWNIDLFEQFENIIMEVDELNMDYDEECQEVCKYCESYYKRCGERVDKTDISGKVGLPEATKIGKRF
eukprot:UN08908